jgi:hypothetical protein
VGIALSGAVPASVSLGGVNWGVSLASGVLTFTAPSGGTAASNAQALLRNLEYSYSSAPAGNRTLSWRATDLSGNVSEAAATSISHDSAGPVVDLLGASAGLDYTATIVTTGNASTGVALSSNASLTEPNSIASVNVTVAGLLNGSSEKLSVGSTDLSADGSSLPVGVSDGTNTWNLSYSAGTFSFSIDGASASQAQTLISSLRYKNSAGTLTDEMRTFTVSATDAFGQTSASSAVATVLVNGGAPAVASSSSLVTADSNGDGVYGDAFTVTFAEPVLSSNIKNAANWSVSNPALAIQSAGFSSSTGWVVTSANSTTGTLTINSSGNSRATFNGGGNTVGSLLQQVLNTVPGQSYSVSFTLASSSTGSVSVQAAALNGPSTLAYNTATTSSNSPTTFSLNFVALSANTLLQFRDTATTAGSDAWLDTLTVVTPASSTTGSLGSSPRIEALNAFMLGGVEYASQYRITSGSGSAYGTNSTLSIPNTAVVDITNTAAGVSGNQTFTMTDITPPAGLTAGDAAITTDNIISTAAGDATVTLTYNFTVSDATHSKVRYYLDGVELTGKMSTVSTPSTATSASLTMDRADWGSDGIKSLTARLEDSSGNLGPLSQSRPVTVDTQIMQGVASMVRTTGSNASATAGDVISVTFNEAVLLGTLPAAFGSTASAVAVGAVGGYSKTWNITLGGTGISLSGSTGSVSFAGVKDVGQNTGTLTASVPADVLAMPQITSLGNVTSDNVINSSEAAAQQTMNLELATVRAGDEIKLYRDGVPISFIVTVSGVDQEVSSYSLPVGVSSTTTLPIKLKTDTWGADGERVLTATIQRGGGTLFASDERHVYVAADLGHWSTANGNAIWFDPSTEISLSDGIWAASVGGLQTSAVNATKTPTLVRSSDGANYVSFNATVNVSSTAAVLQTSVPTSTLDMAGKTSFSIFNVQQRASTAGATQLFSLGVGSTEATGYINGYSSTFNWTRNAVRAYSANSTIALQPALVDVVTAVSGSGSDLTATDTSYINGKQSATATNNISSYAYSQSLAFGGNAALTYGVHVHDGSWTGDLILFNRAVTSLSARQEINTYLAIKYKTMGNAVTAPSSGVFNLSSSAASDTLIDDVLDRRTTGAIDDTALIAGNDWVNAGAGNDTLRIKDLQFRQIDGGAGTDKLALDGTYSGASAIVLADFVSNVRGDSASDSAGNARVAAAGFHSLLGIEQIDLRTHTAAQSLVVTAADVNQISETNDLGVVLGANDSLSVDGFASSSATWGYFTPSDGAVYDQKWVGGSGSYTLYALGGSLPTLTAVSGTTGSDTLVGTSADETLSGGRGDDTLTGGAGVDIFRFNGGEIGSDTVTDFTKSQGDKLDLTGLLLNKGLDSALSDSVSRYLSLSRVGGSSDMALRVDLDGEGNFTSPEQTIALSSAWGSSNLGEPGNTTQELSNLMTLIANRVIVA